MVRRGDRHDPRDLTVSIRFEGDFAAAFREGRSDGVIPGETLRGVVHQVVRDHGGGEIEALGLALCGQVLDHRQVSRVRVEIAEQPWIRLYAGGQTQGQAFVLGGSEQRTAAVTSNGAQSAVVAGIDQLVLMRTAGFLPRTGGRSDDGAEDGVQDLLVGSLSAHWTYSTPEITFGPYRQGVRAAIVDTFAMHAARSVQYTLYAIADVVLAAYQEILDITLTMQERPHGPPGLFHAPSEEAGLFVAGEEPRRLVEVTVERNQAPPP